MAWLDEGNAKPEAITSSSKFAYGFGGSWRMPSKSICSTKNFKPDQSSHLLQCWIEVGLAEISTICANSAGACNANPLVLRSMVSHEYAVSSM